MQETQYNPLDKHNLGVSVMDAILQRCVQPLPPSQSFVGAGIYAIYYTGDFKAYQAVAERNRNEQYAWPIYIGKAMPAGARKGVYEFNDEPGTELYKRLVEHAQSIVQAQNLDIADFKCRYLIVDDIWIPLGESLLIHRFRPVWNIVVDGFGNHDPGGGRYKQQRSSWDVLHPGRDWAEKCQPNKRSRNDILDMLKRALADMC
jgi:hypothetical protein